MSQQPAPWPFNLDDPARAVHFALDPHCPYLDHQSCPVEGGAIAAVAAYKAWAAVHTTPAQPELTPTERQFLAADRMASEDGFTDEDDAALARLRQLAKE